MEELSASDPTWWPGLLGEIAERGLNAALAEKAQRGWAWGALWRWIQEEPKRASEYQQAIEAYSQLRAHETIGIADGSDDPKLQVDTRFKFAGKVDRGRWGDQVTHNVVVDSFGDMLRRVSERKLAALKESQGGSLAQIAALPDGAVVIEHGPQPVAQEEI